MEERDTKDVISKDEFKMIWISKKEQRWKGKRMYGQFVREIPESTDAKKTWTYYRKTDLKIQTESFCEQHKKRPSEQTALSTRKLGKADKWCEHSDMTFDPI